MTVDVVVVGLGTAGAAVAAACARRGLSVLGLEARPPERAGACWVNGVPLHAFRTADLPLPPEALRGASIPFHMKAGWDGPKLCVRDHDLLEVDMTSLTTALSREARENGAQLRHEATVDECDATGVTVAGERIDARCLVVRATGMRDHTHPPSRENICSASQQTREVTDLDAARAFFRRHGVPPGEVLCFTGLAGGFSIINVRLAGDHLEILTGAIPGRGHKSGLALTMDFAKSHDWVGATLSGGARGLPLGLPIPRLDHGGVVRVGDAAGMVHAAHGSGIAQQLHAAGLVADTLAAGGSGWDINVAWQRRYGGLLASADVFRRFSCDLSLPDLSRLMERGVLTESLFTATLVQRSPRPSPRDVATIARGLAKIPGLAAKLAPVLGRMQAVELWASNYPNVPSKVEAWAARREQLAGSLSRR